MVTGSAVVPIDQQATDGPHESGRGPGRATRCLGRAVYVGAVPIGGEEIVIVAGPCAIESEEQMLLAAKAAKVAGAHLLRGGAFKPRTSPYEFRGLGEEGLRLLAQAGKITGLPVVTEVLSERQVELVASYSDMLQIGSRNMSNFTLLEEVGRAGKPVLLKRGMAARIKEWLLAAEYVLAQGNDQVILCERGIRTHDSDYSRNTLDLNAIAVLKRETQMPVLADPSHAAGRAELVAQLGRAALAAGADGLMLEIHPAPAEALCDGRQSLSLEQFSEFMRGLGPLAEVCGRRLRPSAG